MSTKIKSFMQVSFSHSFYENGVMRSLSIVPTAPTSQFMLKAGLYSKIDGNKLVLGCNLEKTEGFLEEPTQQIMLAFCIKNENIGFQSITDLPMYPPNENLLYFDNLEPKQVDKNGYFQLSKDEQGFVSEKDLFSVERPIFPIKETTSQKTKKVEKITTPIGTILYPSHSLPEHQQHIDLTPHTPNLLMVFEETKARQVYCFSNPLAHSFGMLHLYFNREMLNKTSNYQVRFAHRHTYWRYYFIGTMITEEIDIKITHQSNDVTFSLSDKMKTLVNGTQARVAISEKIIPTLEQQQGYFSASIELDKESRQKVTIRLPNPEPKNLRGEQVGEEIRLYSDVYIYT